MMGSVTVGPRAGMLLAAALACGLAGCVVENSGPVAVHAARDQRAAGAFSQERLDQMLAPIALYPDPLLSQMLMAATYPLEVVEAARWSRANSGYQGDDAVRAVQQYAWDPSVKSLVAVPRILDMMDQKLEWTEDLGDAFLSQPAQVMDTIQRLRRRAYAAGYLRSGDEISVQSSAQFIYIEYADPGAIFVPYYDTTVVYGAWWWPDYPPVQWAPWPGYYMASGFGWARPTYVSGGFFFGACDWRQRRVEVVNPRNYYYAPSMPRPATLARDVNAAPMAWRHDPEHRRGVPYRSPELRREYGRTFGPGAGSDSPDRRFGPNRTAQPERGEPYGRDQATSAIPPRGMPVAPPPGAQAPQRVWIQQGAQPVQESARAPAQPGSGAPQRIWIPQQVQPAQAPVRAPAPSGNGMPPRLWIQQEVQQAPSVAPQPQAEPTAQARTVQPQTDQPQTDQPQTGPVQSGQAQAGQPQPLSGAGRGGAFRSQAGGRPQAEAGRASGNGPADAERAHGREQGEASRHASGQDAGGPGASQSGGAGGAQAGTQQAGAQGGQGFNAGGQGEPRGLR